MNDQQKAKWERIRKMGMGRFILLYAVIFSGAWMAVTSVFDYVTSDNGFNWRNFYVRLPIFLIGGLLLSAGIWFFGEYRYRKNSGDGRP